MIRRGSVVRDHPDPPSHSNHGGLAQLGEHLLCKQGVVGSIPSSSTKCCSARRYNARFHLHSTPKRLGASPGCFVVDCGICCKSIGCSLTIHRVESALFTETASWRTVPWTTFLIASNELQFRVKSIFEDGITREVKDLAIP